mmetsp:Transcript_26124/g.42821  ORF Transcript_26124/g.42821 Transcript_26124/m.42821 type:complete len:151 (-) Transcript_26124:2128-2580(-)
MLYYLIKRLLSSLFANMSHAKDQLSIQDRRSFIGRLKNASLVDSRSSKTLIGRFKLTPFVKLKASLIDWENAIGRNSQHAIGRFQSPHWSIQQPHHWPILHHTVHPILLQGYTNDASSSSSSSPSASLSRHIDSSRCNRLLAPSSASFDR